LVTIPTIYGPETYLDPVWNSNVPDWALNPPGAYGNVYNDPQRFSSQVPTNGTSFTTFQMEMDHYTGNVKVQGAQNYESVWADVTNVQSYYNKTGTDYINVAGYHPLLRLVSDQWPGTEQVQLATATAYGANGVITAITVNQAGYGYLAPPKVSIIGLGAGAGCLTCGLGAGLATTCGLFNKGCGLGCATSCGLACDIVGAAIALVKFCAAEPIGTGAGG
jgi:hypothetical protein